MKNDKKTLISQEMPRSKKLSVASALLAVSLIISLFENALPPVLPTLPYAKLGLANGVILAVFALTGVKWAFTVSMTRCFLVAAFSGNFFALVFSVPAAIASIGVTWALFSLKKNSLPAVSAAGAIAHNAVQVAVGAAVTGSASLFSLMPYMCLFGAVAGVATGIIGFYLIRELF